MVIIKTKVLPATNYRGCRIQASANGFKATISYPHEFSYEKCHFEAVKALVTKNKLDWNLGNMRWGDSADGKGYVFCFDCSIVGGK